MAPKRKSRLKVLFILDPLKKLDLEFDTSLGLLRELASRGHEIWTADAHDLMWDRGRPAADARLAAPASGGHEIHYGPPRRLTLGSFRLILVRKEPPFDIAYIAMTYLLELASEKVFISNHPAGIRNANEKLSALHFPAWIPPTLAAASPLAIETFRRQIKSPLVIKPLTGKGGEGIFLYKGPRDREKLLQATKAGGETVIAQKFLRGPGIRGDKRILTLDGKIIAAYEKRFTGGDFRANLSLGGSYHPTDVTRREKALVKAMAPYMKRQGLHLTGLDVMAGRLIEMNVTCPAGLMEAKRLYPRSAPVEAWADYLEFQARRYR